MLLLLGIGLELFNLDLPWALGVVIGTGVIVPDHTGVCETIFPTVGITLNSIILKSMSVKYLCFTA